MPAPISGSSSASRWAIIRPAARARAAWSSRSTGRRRRQGRVADELVDQPAAVVDLVHDHPEEPVEQGDDLGGVLLGGQGGGADQVDEEHGDDPVSPPSSTSLSAAAAATSLPTWRPKTSRRVSPVAQATDHLVEAGLELPELGAVVHLQLDVEVGVLDVLHRVAHGDDRRDDGARVEPGDEQAEDEHDPAECQDHHRQAVGADLAAAEREGEDGDGDEADDRGAGADAPEQQHPTAYAESPHRSVEPDSAGRPRAAARTRRTGRRSPSPPARRSRR